MKKKTLITWLVVLLCLALLVVILQQCNHEDLITFEMAEASEITLEELLSPSYVTIGSELGNYGENGDSYMFVMEHRPGAYIKGTYIDAEVVNFLADRLAEEGV